MTELQKKPKPEDFPGQQIGTRYEFSNDKSTIGFRTAALDYYKARCAVAEEALLKVDVEGDDHSHNIVQAALVVIAASDGPMSETLLDFALRRWHETVANRPLVNVHRRTLDDTWRQVIEFAGGDAEALIGPRHDAMLEEQAAIAKSLHP